MIGVLIAVIVCVVVGALCLRFVRRQPWDAPTDRILSAFIARHAKEHGFDPGPVWVSESNQTGAAIEKDADRILLIAKKPAREGRPEGYRAFFGGLDEVCLASSVSGRSIELAAGPHGSTPFEDDRRYVLVFPDGDDWEHWTALLQRRLLL